MLRLSYFLALIENAEDCDKFEKLYYEYEAQMMFLYIAKNMDKIDVAISDRTRNLMLLVTKHCALDVLRRRDYRDKRSVELDTVYDLASEEIVSMLGESDLAIAMSKLKGDYQTVILLRYACNVSTREIAAILDFTVSKVEKLLQRGKKMLADLLEEVRSQ